MTMTSPRAESRASIRLGAAQGPVELSLRSVVFGHYEAAVDRESAYEQLAKRATEREAEPSEKAAPKSAKKAVEEPGSSLGEAMEAFAKSAMRAAGSQVGRQVMRGLLESMLGAPAPRRRRR